MIAAIIIIALVAIIVVALVVAAPRIPGFHQLGPRGRSRRRPLAGDRVDETGFRGRRRREPSEHVLLAEGEEIQQQVEAQVARDRARTQRRFERDGRAAADRIAPQAHQPLAPGERPHAPGLGTPGYDPSVDPAYARPGDPRSGHPGDPRYRGPGDPAYGDPGYVRPADGFGRPLDGPSRGEMLPADYTAEDELRERARAARIASAEAAPRPADGRRRLWPSRPRRGGPPVGVDPRDGRPVNPRDGRPGDPGDGRFVP